MIVFTEDRDPALIPPEAWDKAQRLLLVDAAQRNWSWLLDPHRSAAPPSLRVNLSESEEEEEDDGTAEGPSLLVGSHADEDVVEEEEEATIRPRKRRQMVIDSSEEDIAAEVPLKRISTEIPPVTATSKKRVTHKPVPVAGAAKKKKRDLASLKLNLGKDAHLLKKLRLDRKKVPKDVTGPSVDDVAGDKPSTTATPSVSTALLEPVTTISEAIVAGSSQVAPSTDVPPLAGVRPNEKSAVISPSSSSSNNLYHVTLRIGDTVYDLSSDENTVEEVQRARGMSREERCRWVTGSVAASLVLVTTS